MNNSNKSLLNKSVIHHDHQFENNVEMNGDLFLQNTNVKNALDNIPSNSFQLPWDSTPFYITNISSSSLVSMRISSNTDFPLFFLINNNNQNITINNIFITSDNAISGDVQYNVVIREYDDPTTGTGGGTYSDIVDEDITTTIASGSGTYRVKSYNFTGVQLTPGKYLNVRIQGILNSSSEEVMVIIRGYQTINI